MPIQKAKKWTIHIITLCCIVIFCLLIALIVMYQKDVTQGRIMMRAFWELEHKYPDFTREEIANIAKQALQNYERDGLDGYDKYKGE